MTLRAIIVDLGGVLIERADWSGHRKWESRLGLDAGGLVRLARRMGWWEMLILGKMSEHQLLLHLQQHFDLNDQERDELGADFWSGEHLNTTLARFLQGVRPRYKVAVLSNGGGREALERKFSISSLADTIMLSSEEGMAKPDSRLYRKVLDYLGVQPEEAVFLDDDENNVEAACRLRIHGIQFKNTDQAIADIQTCLAAMGHSKG